MQKQSPPMPVMCGSTTHSTATAVTAASAALPPARSVSMAASEAKGCEHAAMPSQAMTGDRPGSWKSRLMCVSVMRLVGLFEHDLRLPRAPRDREPRDHVDETD